MLLFAQLAIAAYACPGLLSEGGTASHLAATTGDHVINCDDRAAQQSAPASDNLCAEPGSGSRAVRPQRG